MDGRRSAIPFLTHQSGPDRAPRRLIHPPASLALFFSPTLLICLPRIVSIDVCVFFISFYIKSLWVRASKTFCCVNLAEKNSRFPLCSWNSATFTSRRRACVCEVAVLWSKQPESILTRSQWQRGYLEKKKRWFLPYCVDILSYCVGMLKGNSVISKPEPYINMFCYKWFKLSKLAALAAM